MIFNQFLFPVLENLIFEYPRRFSKARHSTRACFCTASQKKQRSRRSRAIRHPRAIRRRPSPTNEGEGLHDGVARAAWGTHFSSSTFADSF